MILDASVVTKWFVEEKDTDKALEIREKYFQDEFDITVPDLVIYEVANALRYSNFNSEEINKAISTIYSMNLFIVDPSEKIIDRSSDVAIDNDITIYDATYVALSDYFSSSLITADRTLYDKTKSDFDVKFLPNM